MLHNVTVVTRIMRQAGHAFVLCAGLWLGSVRNAGAEVRYLLIPDATGNRVMAFDPTDGHIISENFIPDDGRLVTPKAAIASGRGTVLVADQVADAVFEYGLDGVYIRTIANNSTHGIDNIRGIAVRNGVVYITCASGTHANTIQKVSLAGVSQGTFASTNINSPLDILFRGADVLVSNSGTDDIERYDLNGVYLNKLVDSDSTNNPDFPQQMFARTNGNLLVTSFSEPVGIFEYDSSGVKLNYFAITGQGVRGVHELGNGEILYTQGETVAAYNRTTGESRAIHSNAGIEGVQYIHSVLVRVNISGTVTLEDCASSAQPLTFEFRPTDGSPTFTRVVTPDPDGDFTVANVPAKEYTVAIKGARWLQKVVAANGLSGDVTGVNALLLGGDANDDNSADVLDLDLLIQTFDKCEGDAGFIPGADFNADNCADALDLDILLRNFDQTGDA